MTSGPMRFDPPLVPGTFHRRYKRFLVDATLEGGEEVVAHSTNTGALLGCLREGAPTALRPADNPKRKLQWTWTMIQPEAHWVGVDTSLAVPLVSEAIDGGLLPELEGYQRRVTEVAYGREGRSRIDLLLSRGGQVPDGTPKRVRAPWVGDERVYVEVKTTTLVEKREGRRVAMFPDAVTTRGRKHLDELADVVAGGQRAAMVYVVQREDCEVFDSADHIDPEYGDALRRALAAGVEAYALNCRVSPEQLVPLARLELIG